MDCPQKKWPLCREVAISEGSTVLVNGKITGFFCQRNMPLKQYIKRNKQK